MNTEPGQNPITNKGADDPDKKVPNESKASPTNDFAGEPPCDDSDQQDNQQALVRHMHLSTWGLGQGQRVTRSSIRNGHITASPRSPSPSLSHSFGTVQVPSG
jgi:hypothetical protein